MTIWISLTDLARLNYLHRMRSLANFRVVLVRTRSIYTQLQCGLPLDVGQSHIATTSTCSWMCCSLQTFFETFRVSCLEYYSLDPMHYYTTPGLVWDEALRMSRVHLQLITDIYHFVENSIRGGISMISTRHAQANSHSFPDTYDSRLPNQNLIYLDANNLYRWQCLNHYPLMDFVFQQDEISVLKLQRLSDDAEDGYIFEVDLHYLTHLHDRHDDYPLAPSHND